MSVILIAACYWNKANNWGAFAAIIAGAFIPVSFLVMQEIELTQALTQKIGPYKTGVATYLVAAFAMIAGSLIKNNFKPASS